ncbi:hypothetical protein ABW20_dc0100695 [Dactylellina cionopaga]|nr:hypothetical protein ABW20_dc0100695 [Dactylellina cionopaga]
MTDTQGRITQRFVAIGANRIPNASDCDINSGLIAYGAGNVIALWRPDETETCRSGIVATLKGHTDKVNVVRFVEVIAGHGQSVLVSGSVDKDLRLWKKRPCSASNDKVGVEEKEPRYELVGLGQGHEGSIVDIAVERQASRPISDEEGQEEVIEKDTIIASASADGTVKIWKLNLSDPDSLTGDGNHTSQLTCIQTITTKPKYFPLSVSLARLSTTSNCDYNVWILAVAGSSSTVQIYVGSKPRNTEGTTGAESGEFKHAAALTGHENWVRSLSFVRDEDEASDTSETGSDLLLASGSQDRYIRLWRIHRGTTLPARSAGSNMVIMGQSLSNKAHRFEIAEKKYSVTFEALLVGCEDWVYTVSWKKVVTKSVDANGKNKKRTCLLSASADNSLAIWEADETSGVWVCTARLGEASGMKGSSTATGSTGGFWTGLWAPNGRAVASFGKSGGWRRWAVDDGDGEGGWVQTNAISGHVRDVMGVAWEKEGRYLLSTR